MLRYRTEEERKKWYFQYLLTNDIAFKEIRTYNLAEYFIHKVKGIYDDFFKQDKSYYKKSSEISLLISILDELCMGVLFCIVIFDTYAGNILIGDSVAYINVSSNIKSTLKQLLAQISAIYNDNLYINQIFEFLDMPEEEQIKRMEKHIDEINTITVENLSYRYNSNNRYALKDVSFSLSKGDIVAIVGKNGAGKSTLLRLLLGELPIGESHKGDQEEGSSDGSIEILGQDIRQFKDWSSISYVPQNGMGGWKDFPASVEEIVRANLYKQIGLFRFAGKKERQQVRAALAQVGMEEYQNRLIGRLSGGQQQRVLLARALVNEPKLLILDEPTRGIDIGTKTEIQKLVLDLADQGMAVTFISSEVEEMLRTCSRMAVLRDGQKVGELEEDELSQSGVMKAIAGGDDK